VRVAMSELQYHERVPMSWRALAGPLAEVEADRLARDNERLLRQFASLESPLESGGEEDAPPARHLQVLEARLQLMAELLGELLAQARPLPPRHPIWLSGRTLAWIDHQPPQPGARLLVELFLHESLPRPLRLPVRVERLSAEGDGTRVHTELDGVTEGVVEQLEKLAFRQHRRFIASRRGRGG